MTPIVDLLRNDFPRQGMPDSYYYWSSLATMQVGMNDDDLMTLATMITRMRGEGDLPDRTRDVWHSGHFESKEAAQCLAEWLCENKFFGITLRQGDRDGWRLDFFQFGTGHLSDLVDCCSEVCSKIQEFGGRYVGGKIQVMYVESLDVL